MELTVKCVGFFDTRGVASEFVGDAISFSFDKETGTFHVPVESKEQAEDVASRLSLYDLDYPYHCHFIGENKEPELITEF